MVNNPLPMFPVKVNNTIEELYVKLYHMLTSKSTKLPFQVHPFVFPMQSAMNELISFKHPLSRRYYRIKILKTEKQLS